MSKKVHQKETLRDSVMEHHLGKQKERQREPQKDLLMVLQMGLQREMHWVLQKDIHWEIHWVLQRVPH